MPRQPRLNAPGTLHHVMGRGIEGTRIFRKDVDREDFLSRLGNLCREGAMAVYAWSILESHFHLLVRTGHQPIDRVNLKIHPGKKTSLKRKMKK